MGVMAQSLSLPRSGFHCWVGLRKEAFAHGAFFVLLLGRFHSKGLGTSPPTGDLEDFMDFIPICILLAFSFYSGVSFWRCECLGVCCWVVRSFPLLPSPVQR